MQKNKQKPQPKNTLNDTHKKVENAPIVSSNKNEFLFKKRNYQLMLIGLLVILLGYALMMGGENNTPGSKFPYEEIYSFRRIILSPIIIIIGFVIEIYAILSAKKS